jgi:thiamine-phosphate pyrophosphorylase
LDHARLHLITPERLDRGALEGAAAALATGGRWLQVRAKEGTDRSRYLAACALVAEAHRVGATCVVNDRTDLALASGADGVHLGLDDVPVAAVRAVVPDGFVVGATARNPEQARRAVDEGASYLGVGPVYATTTKAGLPEPIGLAGLAAVAAAVSVPVIAISGITAARVPAVLDAGATGVAVVGAVFATADPAAATRALLDALGANAEPGLRGPNAGAGLRGPNAEPGLRGPNAGAGR